jgi:hypothetical protein
MMIGAFDLGYFITNYSVTILRLFLFFLFHTNRGATFAMSAFQEYFLWACPEYDEGYVPETHNQIDLEKGLINGTFCLTELVNNILL